MCCLLIDLLFYLSISLYSLVILILCVFFTFCGPFLLIRYCWKKERNPHVYNDNDVSSDENEAQTFHEQQEINLRLSEDIDQQKQKLEQLQNKKNTYMKYRNCQRQLYEDIQRNDPMKVKTACILYTEKVLLVMKCHLIEILSIAEQSNFTSMTNMKETYKEYGLLLSACNIRQDESSDHHHVLKKVAELFLPHVPIENAIGLSRVMLTLVPPLLVHEPTSFAEEKCQTFRKTWDERKENGILYYYRPALFYGNSTNVAVKGLVGNTEYEIYEEF